MPPRNSMSGTTVVITDTDTSSIMIAGPSSVITRLCFVSLILFSITFMTLRFRLFNFCLFDDTKIRIFFKPVTGIPK